MAGTAWQTPVCLRQVNIFVLRRGFAHLVFFIWIVTLHTVSPHSVIECVRQWLQLRGNSGKYIRIIFSATTNPDYTKTLVEQYFPLAPYYFSSGGMKDENSTSGEESEIEVIFILSYQHPPKIARPCGIAHFLITSHHHVL